MIKIENVEIYGFEAAIRGMRNPMNSWDKSDSYWTYIEDSQTGLTAKSHFFIGDNDLKLMKQLSKAGNDHAKYLRMINVTLDITAPLYWWKEFDTYKVGTVANSCSTMHKIHAKEFTLDDFSCEHLLCDLVREADGASSGATQWGLECFVAADVLELTIDMLNQYRELFVETKDKKYWWQMIQLLPSSYNQKRTVQLNYQVLKNMYHSRRHHKLDEWHTLCDWMEELPYFKEVCL